MPPQGTATIHEADKVESGQFSFTATETGDYLACILVSPLLIINRRRR